MKIRFFCVFLLGLFLFAADGSGFAQPKVERIEQLMTQYHRDGQFNGSALVVERGRIIYRKSFGFANFEWNVPNTPDTKFRIGSITKSFTAILTLQLVEQGKLKLEGKVTDYLPNFFRRTGDQITINQLLTHTSGLPDYNNVPDLFRMVQSGLLSNDQTLKRISEYELLFEPGAKFGYSNDGYRVLGAIIEKVANKPYAQVLQENILDPLNMCNTGYSSRGIVLTKRASGYRKTLVGLENAAFYEASPASGMYSTVEDLFIYDQALYTNKLLAQKWKVLMWQIVPSGNAYGWHVSKITFGQNKNSLKVMTEGAVFGFFARLVRLPQNKQTIILLTNVRAATNWLPDVERGLINILYGEAYDQPKKSIAETLFQTVQQKGIEATLRQYRDLKTQSHASYRLAENELNRLGYQLLNMRRVKDAIEIFKLNVEAYPESSNAYDSLGEAYMMDGNKELAIKNYQKSVELNPQNTNGVEMLKKLTGQ